MLYLAHAQQPTSVTHALKCDLLQPSIDCLVVCKHNKIEVHRLEPTGLKLVLEEPVFGAVECLQAVKPKGATLSTLLILTASLDFFALSLSPKSTPDRPPILTTTSSYSLKRPSSRIAQYTVTLSVDPYARCVVAHVWDGELWVVPIKAGKDVDVGKGFELKLPELSVRSFESLRLSEEVGPTVSYVYSDYTGKRYLRTRTITLSRKAFDEDADVRLGGGNGRTRGELKRATVIECEDETAETVIPVPGPSGSVASAEGEAGVLVLSEESVSFVGVTVGADEEEAMEVSPGKGKGKATRRRSSASVSVGASGGRERAGSVWKRRCDLPVSYIKCWTAIDSQPDTFLLGDVIGKLFLLHLHRSSSTGTVDSLSVTELGDASAPEQLVHLQAGFVFVGSHFGDSQLVRIPALADDEDPMAVDSESKAGLDLVATWTNLAPIVDFCVVDEPALGQSYIVTCSGAHQDGSLRLVRHGVGLKDLGSVDFGSVQRVWGVRTKAGEREGQGKHDALVLSQVDSTRFLAFEADGIEEVASLPGFSTDAPTLAAGMLGGTAVQVTGDGVATLGGARWSHEGGQKITVAEVGEDAVLVAMEGGDVRKLQSSAGGLEQTASAKLSYDVACIDVDTSLGLVAAGQWTANTVAILSLADLGPLSTVSTETTYHIRSVLFASFSPSSSPYLFIGLGDGTLLSSAIDPSTGSPKEGTRKSVALGTRPITMTPFTATGGVPSVLVNSDRPTVVTRSNDRLQYASVNVAGVVAATSFDADEFRDSLVLALPDSLRIARIDELTRMHVDTLPLEGEQPRRIAHSMALRAFGVICLREELDRETGMETTQGSFKIIDDTTFAVLHDFPLVQEKEQGLSVITAPLADNEEHFIVGTAETELGAQEAEHGRLLAFRYAGEKTYELAHTVDVGGAAYSVASLPGGRLACSANAFVHVYEPSPSGPAFKKLSSWGGAFISVRLATRGNTVLVADAFRSIVMLEFDPKLGTLSEEARDYNAHGARSLAALAEEEFVGSDVDHNVFTVGRGQPGTGALAAPGELSPMGAFHVGEYVTQFANGSLVPKFVGENAPGRPKIIFATSTGSIGVIAEVEDPTTASLLSGLERNMRRVVKGLGNIDQLAYRAFKKEKRDQPPVGFIDGAFVETLVDLDEETVEQVMRGGSAAEMLGVSKGEVVRLVEEMARLH